MHSDAFGHVWMRLDALECSRKGSEFFGKFETFLVVLGCFLTFGAYFCSDFKVMGPTICGANYSEPALCPSRN